MLSAYVELCLHNDLMGGQVSQGDGGAVACFSGKITCKCKASFVSGWSHVSCLTLAVGL